MKKSIAVLFLLFSFFIANGEDSLWTLQSCIHYAQANNLSIKIAELDARSNKLVYEYSKYNRLPNLSANTNYGTNLGRSINPTTNAFESTQFSSVGLSAGANVLLFGWFEKKYAIQNNNLKYQSATLILDQIKNDLVLNVATAYLRVLLAKEQVSNTLLQIAVSNTIKSRMENLLQAGKSNLLEMSQANTQLSNDSSLYFQSLLNREQAFIDLKAVLNLDLANNMELEVPQDVENGLIERPDAMQVFQMAESQMPSMKNNSNKVAIARKEISLTKTNLYPKLSLYVSTGTNYSSSFYETLPNGDRELMNFGKQFQNNLSQSVGIGLSIPIFNNLSTQQSIKAAKINLERVEVMNEDSRLKLKQDVYKAVLDYELTRQNYYAKKSALANAELAFKAAGIRFENGLIAQFEFITVQNNYLRLQNEVAAMKYDLYFKKLTIDYYQGKFY